MDFRKFLHEHDQFNCLIRLETRKQYWTLHNNIVSQKELHNIGSFALTHISLLKTIKNIFFFTKFKNIFTKQMISK